MTDLELLELAAKAAGVRYDPEASKPHPVSKAWFGLWLTYDREPTEYDRRRWNPLADDGDALRLAVGLKIDIEQFHDCVYANGPQCTQNYQQFEWHANHCAATRRAVVRVAAALADNA